MLAGALVLVLNLIENFSDHLQGVDLLDVLDLALQILVRQSLDVVHFLSTVLVIVHSASIGQCVMHRQLLLQVSDLLL